MLLLSQPVVRGIANGLEDHTGGVKGKMSKDQEAAARRHGLDAFFVNRGAPPRPPTMSLLRYI